MCRTPDCSCRDLEVYQTCRCRPSKAQQSGKDPSLQSTEVAACTIPTALVIGCSGLLCLEAAVPAFLGLAAGVPVKGWV
eukprot:1511893-Alexandrium_andersonii.AAC.1